MTVRLNLMDYKAIVAQAQAALPYEACGLIAGRVDGEIKTVEKVYPLANPERSPERFSIDPREQLAAVKDMRGLGLTPLGNYHSHPSTPARPSGEDLRQAHDPGASYLILSLAGENSVLRAFGISGGAAFPQALEII